MRAEANTEPNPCFDCLETTGAATAALSAIASLVIASLGAAGVLSGGGLGWSLAGLSSLFALGSLAIALCHKDNAIHKLQKEEVRKKLIQNIFAGIAFTAICLGTITVGVLGAYNVLTGHVVGWIAVSPFLSLPLLAIISGCMESRKSAKQKED